MANEFMTPASGPKTDTISYEDFVKWKNRIQSEVPEKDKQAGYISALRDIVDADVPTDALADILKPVYNEEAQKPRGRPDVMEAEKLGTDSAFRLSPAMQEPDKTGLSLTSPDDPLSPEKLMATPKSFGPQDLLRPGGPEEDQTLNIEGPFSYENLMKPAFQYGPDKLARPADQAGDVVVPGEPLKSEEEIDKKDLSTYLPQDWTKYVGLGALALFPAIVARMTGGDKETMMRAYAGGGKGLEEFGKQWLQSKRVKPDVVDIGGIPHQIMYDKDGNPVLTPIPGAKKAAEAAQSTKIAGQKEIIEAEGGQRIKLAELQGEIDEKIANLKGKSDIEKAQYAGQLDREIKELQIAADKYEADAKIAAQANDAEREAELKRLAEQNRLQIESKKAENDFLRNSDENKYKTKLLELREKEVDALNKLRDAQADKAKADAKKPPKPGATGEPTRKEIDAQVLRLSDKLSGFQPVYSTINDIEREIGFNLDDYDEKTGMIDGKKVNVPGVSIKGVGRVSFFSTEASGLASKVDKILNVVIKDRAGAVVTTNEMDRIRSEFGSGKFNSEEQLFGALKNFKRAVQADMKNVEAGYIKDAVTKYSKQGGLTSTVIRDVERTQMMLKKDPKGPNAEKLRQALRARGLVPLY